MTLRIGTERLFVLEMGKAARHRGGGGRTSCVTEVTDMSDKPLVNCSVSNCKFWGDYRCQASEIMIEIDKHASANLKSEFADEYGPHKDTASKSSVTCCQTFEPK